MKLSFTYCSCEVYYKYVGSSFCFLLKKVVFLQFCDTFSLQQLVYCYKKLALCIIMRSTTNKHVCTDM
jgi:hypothetical protein